MPFIPPSIPLSQMSPREEAQFFAQQGIQATGGGGPNRNGVQTFTPATWNGFSSDPSDISYIDLGAAVMLWGGTLGTSDDTSFSFEALPAAIRPSIERDTTVLAHDNGVIVLARANVLTNGIVAFSRSDVPSAGPVTFPTGAWTNSGQKGLVGALIYPK